MRFVKFLLIMVLVLFRLAVVISPFVILYFYNTVAGRQFIKTNHLYLWSIVWSVVSFFVLFGRDIVASTMSEPATLAGYVPEAELDEGRHLDFLTPGTAEYNVFHYTTNNE
jgi:hypothetical protein